MARHDICIVGLKCYDLLAESAVPRYLGGVEKLLVSMARGLSESGVNTAFVTYDHGQPDVQVFDGVTVYKSFEAEQGLPGLRYFHPRTTGIWSAMREADAPVYLQMSASSETGRVALGCRLPGRGRRSFVFALASDKDGDRDAIGKWSWRERALYEYGLSAADLVISQTRKQQSILERSYGRESTVLPMPIESPSGVDVAGKAAESRTQHRVLWVGRIIETKRLEFLFEVAKQCPDVAFDVVGMPNKPSAYFDGLVRQAEKIDNVVLHGRVGAEAMPEFYRSATLLICTSVLEGFPTTFLEAWSYGLPVVTSFDPDDVVATRNLGKVVFTVEDMAGAVREFSRSAEDRLVYGRRVLDFFQRNYTLEAILPRFRRYCIDGLRT